MARKVPESVAAILQGQEPSLLGVLSSSATVSGGRPPAPAPAVNLAQPPPIPQRGVAPKPWYPPADFPEFPDRTNMGPALGGEGGAPSGDKALRELYERFRTVEPGTSASRQLSQEITNRMGSGSLGRPAVPGAAGWRPAAVPRGGGVPGVVGAMLAVDMAMIQNPDSVRRLAGVLKDKFHGRQTTEPREADPYLAALGMGMIPQARGGVVQAIADDPRQAKWFTEPKFAEAWGKMQERADTDKALDHAILAVKAQAGDPGATNELTEMYGFLPDPEDLMGLANVGAQIDWNLHELEQAPAPQPRIQLPAIDIPGRLPAEPKPQQKPKNKKKGR